MKRYEEYKLTGAEWIPSIPASWNIQKIGALFAQRKEKVSDKDFAPISVTKNGILPQLATAAKTDDGDNRKKVCIGDFVINSRSDRKGSCGVSDLEGSVSLINIVLQPRDQLSGRYVHYLLRNHLFSEEYYRNGRGIVADLWTTRYSEMKTILLPVPPRAEQDQIVRYLDWQVSKINRLIATKRKQIKLILNQQQCIIEEAVLHGIEEMSHRAMPTTEWFGSIPANWQKRRIKYLFKLRDERNYLPLSEVNLISLYSKLGVIQNKDIEYKSGNRARNAEGYKKVCVDDMVVNIILCWMGAIGRSAYDGVTSPAYDVYEPRKGTFSRYYHYLFRLPKFGTECYKVGKGIMAMRWRVYSDQFCNIVAPVPPIEEQKRIAEWLDIKTARYTQSINAIEKQIAVLQELRTRLISDVVTGQIDVRDIEVPEYEVVEDADTCEEPEEDTEGEEYEE